MAAERNKKLLNSLIASFVSSLPGLCRRRLLDCAGMKFAPGFFEEKSLCRKPVEIVASAKRAGVPGPNAVALPANPPPEWTEEKILKRLYGLMAPGAWLVVPVFPRPPYNFDAPHAEWKAGKQTAGAIMDSLRHAGFTHLQISELFGAPGEDAFCLAISARKVVRLGKKVSIVVPTYNQAGVLPQTLDSILHQTYKNIELIVINDGSTDDTHEVCLQYKKKYPGRFKYIKQKNMDVPRTINKGFLMSSGDYWTWSSSDNIMYPHLVEAYATYLDNHPQAGLAYCDYSEISDDGDFLRDVRLPDFDPELYLKGNTIGCSFMFRREAMESIGLSPKDDPHAHDYEMFLMASEKFECRHLPVVLYAWRRHDKRSDGHWSAGMASGYEESARILYRAKKRRGLV